MFKKYGEQIDAVVVDTNGDEITDEDSETEPVQSFMVDDFGEGYINEVLSLDSGLNQIQMADETSGETNYQDYFLENASEPAPYRIVLPPKKTQDAQKKVLAKGKRDIANLARNY